MLALQCIDDVNDQKEDEALYGSSVPAALGCEPTRIEIQATLARRMPLPQRGDDVAGACRPYLKTRCPRMRWWSIRSLMIR